MDKPRKTGDHGSKSVLSQVFRMRRVFILLCLLSAVAVGKQAANANEFQFPKTGNYAYRVNLPKGWQTKMDTRGGLLLIPPAPQHALIYLAILVDDKSRGKPDSVVATDVAKIAGIQTFYKQEPALIFDGRGTASFRGTAFYGTMPEKLGLARTAKIMIFHLESNKWAQIWVVTQPGMNAVETDAIDQVLNRITLTTE